MKIQIPTEDGFILRGDIYFASVTPLNKLIILNSAVGVSRQFYEPFAKFIAEQGYAVITYDYRGMGESKPYPHRSFRDACLLWGKHDLDGVIKFVQSMFPKYEIHAIGHGLGGSIFGYCDGIRFIKSILNVASQDSYFNEWPAGKRMKTFFQWRVVSPLSLTIKGQFDEYENTRSGTFNDERVRELSLDVKPSFLRGSSTFSSFAGKLLSIYISDDPMLSVKGIDRMHNQFVNAAKLMRDIFPEDLNVKHIGFFGFFQERFKENLWKMTIQWLSDFEQLGDHVYAKFDETAYPIVKIEFRMAEPTIPEGEAYFENLLSYFRNGEVYFLMDIRRVQWQNMRIMRLASQRVNENADLIRARHKGTAYVVKSGFLRNLIRIFHVVETSKIIRPVRVFSTVPEAMAWLQELHVPVKS